MYGSIHTHFESRFDTANNLDDMVQKFIDLGAKKVAVTEHGTFSSYEDLKDIVNQKKAKAKEEGKTLDFEIIPGVECYFGDERAHLILVAKDYEGYLSLCHIISESNERLVKGNPIVTLENLRKNVAKGHLICTSACINGPFGKLLGGNEIRCKNALAKNEEILEKTNLRELFGIEQKYEETQRLKKEVHPLKREITEAEKIFKKNGDRGFLDEIEVRQQKEVEYDTWLTEHKEEYDEAVTKIKEIGRAKGTKALNQVETLKEELKQIEEEKASGKIQEEAFMLFSSFVDIFGKDDFYFEIQNHGMPEEKEIYNNTVKFASFVDHNHFIASNDIHVGTTKDSDNYEDELLKRNVIRYNRFKKIEEISDADKELCIKDDAELKMMLKESIEGTESATKEEIIDSSIANIENALSECSIEFPKENHYPKFCDDENAEFERLVREGIKEKFPNGFPDDRYEKRLEYELDVIKRMGYAGYHLIVADYLEYGRLLGYLPNEYEIENAPTSIEELKTLIEERGYKKIGYNIGPGRGSAAGSLCCYAMGITDIDPLKYDLLFERFLNVERVSMPDIDSDFRTDIRGKVEDYCRAKYGKECICKIMTKGYGAIKGNLRLAARYLGTKAFDEENKNKDVDFVEDETEQDEVEQPVSETEGEEDTSSLELNEYLRKKGWYDTADSLSKAYTELGNVLPEEDKLNDMEREIVKLAKLLDGVFLNYGQHAAGTIISAHPVNNIIPLMWNEKKGSMETQCTMAQAEDKGLLKMDFLGLENLNIITDIMRNEYDGKTDNLLQDYSKRDEILNDTKIFKDIFWTGLTRGVFQFESPGMKKMLKAFKPEKFEDIILLVAAYRPGPMDYIPEIIATKWYERDKEGYTNYIKDIYPESSYPNLYPKPTCSITLENETLRGILSSTYGVPIYQEQIMQIFQKMAGYSLGGADQVRRYMSKKKVDKLAHEKETFIHGDEERGIPGICKLHGVSEKEADMLFEQMMPFAKYGFNKSHATAYAMVSMFTAYLKEYHTADFFRASMNVVDKVEDLIPYISEMNTFGLTLKAPSIMESENKFKVEEDGKSIRFGFKNIKGFSEMNFNKCESVMGFIELNPEISLKTIEKMAELGLFKETFKQGKNGTRYPANRHEILRWLDKYGEDYKKLLDYHVKETVLSMQKEEISHNYKEGTITLEEYTKKERAIESSFKRTQESINTLKEKLNVSFKEDKNTHYPETNKDILENRKWEVEKLSIPFDIEESLNKINALNTNPDFSALSVSKEDNDNHSHKMIPAIVLSISAPKKTKKGQTYVNVTLMDKNRDIIERRFDSAPNVLDGFLNLAIEDCKYYNCKVAEIRPIKPMAVTMDSKLPTKMTGMEKVNFYKTNTQINKNRFGNKVVPTVIETENIESIEK